MQDKKKLKLKWTVKKESVKNIKASFGCFKACERMRNG